MAKDKRPLMAYLKVQEQHEREMLTILKRASARVNIELKTLEARSGIGAAVRRDQLRLSQSAIKAEIGNLWELMGSQIMADRSKAAAAASNVMTDYDAMLLNAVMSKTDAAVLRRAAVVSAQRSLGVAESRVLGLSRIPLSERVYNSKQLVTGQLDRIIENGLARGVSARELANDVRGFINPNTSGGVKYAAQRLARTELNNAFHATTIRQSVKAPWVTKMRWNISGSHPRPDECDDYADIGLYTPVEVPAKPHPQCLCYVIPETVDVPTFVKEFNAGSYSAYTNRLLAGESVSF